jgi:hypothetical protein
VHMNLIFSGNVRTLSFASCKLSSNCLCGNLYIGNIFPVCILKYIIPFWGGQSVKPYDDMINALTHTTIVTSPTTIEFGFFRMESKTMWLQVSCARNNTWYHILRSVYLFGLSIVSLYSHRFIIIIVTFLSCFILTQLQCIGCLSTCFLKWMWLSLLYSDGVVSCTWHL